MKPRGLDGMTLCNRTMDCFGQTRGCSWGLLMRVAVRSGMEVPLCDLLLSHIEMRCKVRPGKRTPSQIEMKTRGDEEVTKVLTAVVCFGTRNNPALADWLLPFVEAKLP